MAHYGHTITKATRQKMADALRGKTLSIETRRKMAEAHTLPGVKTLMWVRFDSEAERDAALALDTLERGKALARAGARKAAGVRR